MPSKARKSEAEEGELRRGSGGFTGAIHVLLPVRTRKGGGRKRGRQQSVFVSSVGRCLAAASSHFAAA